MQTKGLQPSKAAIEDHLCYSRVTTAAPFQKYCLVFLIFFYDFLFTNANSPHNNTRIFKSLLENCIIFDAVTTCVMKTLRTIVCLMINECQ